MTQKTLNIHNIKCLIKDSHMGMLEESSSYRMGMPSLVIQDTLLTSTFVSLITYVAELFHNGTWNPVDDSKLTRSAWLWLLMINRSVILYNNEKHPELKHYRFFFKTVLYIYNLCFYFIFQLEIEGIYVWKYCLKTYL